MPNSTGKKQTLSPVAHTHLAANETGRKLECRLVLEKKERENALALGMLQTQPASTVEKADVNY
ncbi:hypothetical protein, partial [Microbacterium testaceum]|uniref:hypothetical protein n=1 Tax=Microbacterium testaceum TaxID=2033 RepID=UPI0019D330E8